MCQSTSGVSFSAWDTFYNKTVALKCVTQLNPDTLYQIKLLCFTFEREFDCLTPDNIGVNKNCSLKLLGSKQPSPDSLSSPVDKESVTMPNAKNFLIKVLKIDLDERMTVREVLQHFNVKCWYEEAG
ncbi:hypothetical protein L596_013617 [Steinernema carpocapsae]|uniref:Protein kinase domain-containing protein n=1 Tax=Steinernema carpocapsae TaxID=34508 RepID=A0A4U5P0Q1_STECR|nr:hypothetical protein L596_013617 [Steinernema carpocapsae]